MNASGTARAASDVYSPTPANCRRLDLVGTWWHGIGVTVLEEKALHPPIKYTVSLLVT
jgi:hypothetical protein